MRDTDEVLDWYKEKRDKLMQELEYIDSMIKTIETARAKGIIK